MTALTHWQDNSPFVMRTSIRAQPMNTKLGGISANLQQITTKINGFVVKLPDNFTGNTEIPTQPYTNKLLYINKDGNADLLDKNLLLGQAQNDITIIDDATNALTVNADNHSQFFTMSYAMPVSPTDAESKIIITVGSGLRTVDGDLTAVPGSIIFFTNNSDAELWLAPDENLGVTIDSPGLLRAYSKHSTIALMAISDTHWLLMGDVYVSDVTVTV